MIDIHTHILPLVDDGSFDINDSLNMLKEQLALGVTDVFLTPHLRGRFNLDEHSIKKEFNDFCRIVKDNGINVNLFLGQEIYISPDKPQIQELQQIITLNNSKYVLIEFDFSIYTDIVETVYETSRLGYIPIVCHFERYSYANIELAKEIRQNGGLIQINADSVIGHNKSGKKTTKKLLKLGLVDFVASDMHKGRINFMQQARNLIEKKYGKEFAFDLFYNNAKKIIAKD